MSNLKHRRCVPAMRTNPDPVKRQRAPGVRISADSRPVAASYAGRQGDSAHVVPKIGGQHFEYLRRQIYDAVDGRRPGFPASHVRLLARLDHDDIVGVADYLSRIAPRYAGPQAVPAAVY
jgi:hypothetical protein